MNNMLSTNEIIIDNVSSHNITSHNIASSDFKKRFDKSLVYKNEPKTLSKVCVINDLIMIPETTYFSPSWDETFKNLIGRRVKFYKFMNTIYAYEVDGKKTYMRNNIIMPIVFTGIIGALLYF